MSYLQKQMEVLKYDKRLLEINMKNDNLDQKAYENFLSNLEDSQGNAEKLELASEAETEDHTTSMNGDSHPAESEAPEAQSPINRNNDPFGSGF